MIESRGVEPYAEVMGYYNGYIPGFKEMKIDKISNFYAKCMSRVLDNVGIEKNMVTLIQGSGFGYEKIDKAEAKAIKSLFENKVPVTSSNEAFGFTLGASGAISLVSSIIQMKSKYLTPMSPDRERYFENKIDYLIGLKRSNNIDVVLVNCFDYLGCMSSVVIKKMGA